MSAPIDICPVVDKGSNYFYIFIAATQCSQMNSIFALVSNSPFGINRMLILVRKCPLHLPYFPLVARLEEVLLLLLQVSHILIPNLLQEAFYLRQFTI